ncbi:hypothetical protein [Alienimonas californiensis]|uniref:Uncharacterized protein n=1 Tax=Alienimonas californiensis TaxID=2527989 RepID=A0A517PAP8_9PLAN|nr:hypothetical protein [Alienimonas californiensis]QDT16444.1 hypothetical protein CA12_25470 [Alienimonas californiensis]
MKFSLDGLKNANWKQLAADHAEKAGLVVAALLAAVLLYSGVSKGRYTEKSPNEVMQKLDEQQRALRVSSWTPEQRQADLPEFDVRAEVERVKETMNPGETAWPASLLGPMHRLQEKGSEPTWLPVESVLAEYLALPVRLAPEDALLDAASGEPGADEDEESNEFDLNLGAGGAPAGFGGFDFGGSSEFSGGEMGRGRGMFGSDESSPDSSEGDFDRGRGVFGSEEGGMPFGEEGEYGNPATINARGKGVKMAAIRGVFPFRRQVQEMARSMNVPIADAKARLEFLDLQVERQRISSGANPYSEDWHPVDRDAALELLGEDLYASSGRPIEVVSPALTDPSLTMPLFTPAYGTWDNRPASHPRLKEFDLIKEDPALRQKIEERLREEAVVQQEVQAAVGPQKNRFLPEQNRGFDRGAAMRAIVDRGPAEGEAKDPVRAALEKMSAADVLLLTRFFDIAVEPGQAYRYRMRVQLANPNFGLGAADVSDPSALEGETRWTPWSEPSGVVSIPPDELSYLTAIYPKPNDSLPEARLEVTEYSREYGTLVSKDTRVDAGDLLVFEERNTYTLDPFKQEKNERATYPFVTEHVVIGVDALPEGAAAFHPDLNLGNRSLPPGRVLLMLDTGSVREIDAGLELQRQAVAKSVKAERDGLGPQMTDVNAPKPDPSGEFGEGFSEEFFGRGGRGGSSGP